jgi:hypothetical protein
MRVNSPVADADNHRLALRPGLWLLFALFIIASWVLLFRACALNAPLPWRELHDFCPRQADQRPLIQELARNRELKTLLFQLQSDLANRNACPAPKT